MRHIGWNEVCKPADTSWKGSILENADENSSFYFVHLLTAVPTHQKYRLADCYYNGQLISAVIGKKMFMAVSFILRKAGSGF
jgi:imidazoleglycerol phosphate synthase glutamine amidotransferase subunit HisH